VRHEISGGKTCEERVSGPRLPLMGEETYCDVQELYTWVVCLVEINHMDPRLGEGGVKNKLKTANEVTP